MVRSEGLCQEFLLVAGASREQQFDDFWNVKVTLHQEGLAVTQEKLKVEERDGFSARNGMTAVLSAKDKLVYLFGGQDSERDEQFDEVWVFSHNALQQVEFKPDEALPVKRNSHTMVATETAAYIFGGAN